MICKKSYLLPYQTPRRHFRCITVRKKIAKQTSLCEKSPFLSVHKRERVHSAEKHVVFCGYIADVMSVVYKKIPRRWGVSTTWASAGGILLVRTRYALSLLRGYCLARNNAAVRTCVMPTRLSSLCLPATDTAALRSAHTLA